MTTALRHSLVFWLTASCCGAPLRQCKPEIDPLCTSNGDGVLCNRCTRALVPLCPAILYDAATRFSNCQLRCKHNATRPPLSRLCPLRAAGTPCTFTLHCNSLCRRVHCEQNTFGPPTEQTRVSGARVRKPIAVLNIINRYGASFP